MRRLRNTPWMNPLYRAFADNLKRGIEVYEAKNERKPPAGFKKALFSALDDFGNGQEAQEFGLSMGFHRGGSVSYIDVNMESECIEVSRGGMYSGEFGADSYTNWMYSVWLSGNEDEGEMMPEDFEAVYEFLSDPDVKFSVSHPDEFWFSSDEYYDEDEEDEETEE